MNKKGFTLVEVIVVLAIIALLVIILVPNVFVLIEKNKEESCNSMIKNIESAAQIYVSNNKYNIGFNCGVDENISLKSLVDSGDLKLDKSVLINPINDKTISLEDVSVTVTYDCSSKSFAYVVNGITCEENDDIIEQDKYQIQFIDNYGNVKEPYGQTYIEKNGFATVYIDVSDYHTFDKIEGASLVDYWIDVQRSPETGEFYGAKLYVKIENPTNTVKIYYK